MLPFPYEPHPVVPAELLKTLAGYDTPTICNALELLDANRKNHGYTKGNFTVGRPDLPPLIGYARTAEIRSLSPFEPDEKLEMAMGFYEYVAFRSLPTVVAVQDLDHESAVGANWGEVHTRLFKRLGAVGTVTNGAIRDLDCNHPRYQLLGARTSPSHRNVRFVAFAREVDIFGMSVRHGDLIHMDRHGAVRFPAALAEKLPKAVDAVTQRENLLFDVIDGEDFSLGNLRKAFLQGRNVKI